MITYVFWSLYRYFKKRKWGSNSYTRAIMFFSIPYSLPLGILLIKILEIGYVEESKFLFIILFSICIYISSFPLRFVFPKNKIETLEYTKEEKKQMNRKLLVYFIIVILIIFLICASIKFLYFI